MDNIPGVLHLGCRNILGNRGYCSETGLDNREAKLGRLYE